MRIVHKGDPNPWWVGKMARCFNCKTIVQLDIGDPVETRDAMDAREEDTALVMCPLPECGHQIAMTRSSASQLSRERKGKRGW